MDRLAFRVCLAVLTCLLFVNVTGSAQPAFQVADINDSTLGAAFDRTLTNFGVLGGTVFFSFDDGSHGVELWKSDGTVAGTVLLRDLCPGVCSSRPFGPTVAAGILYFIADDGSHGHELWRSDGTAAGTWMVKDIYPGLEGGAEMALVASGGTLFFPADDGVHGMELWKSDGTAVGTQMVADIRPGPDWSYPVPRVAAGGILLLDAEDGVHGREPWVSDGTEAGTELLVDANPGSGDSLDSSVFSTFNLYTSDSRYHWTALPDGSFLFALDDGVHGREPWVSDGTPAGTSLLLDIQPGAESSGPAGYTELGGQIYFSANDGAGLNNYELWRTDGTPAGTQLFKEIQAGGEGSHPWSFTAIGSLLFFAATDGSNGSELWVSNGTAAGTVLLKDISPGVFDSSPTRLAQSGSTLLFLADDGSNGREVWRSDGTAAGTVRASDAPESLIPHDFLDAVAAGGRLFFYHGILGELWASDGSAAGTSPLGPIWEVTPVPSSIEVFVATTYPFSAHGNRLLFPAYDFDLGLEPWVTDGTLGGTQLLGDLMPGPDSSYPFEMTYVNGTTLFEAAWSALFKTDGTAAGTEAINHSDYFFAGSQPTLFRGSVYLAAEDLFFFGRELMKLEDFEPFTEPTVVKDIRPGAASSGVDRLTVSGSRLFFTAAASAEGSDQDMELFQSDGTGAGTGQVKDIRPGPAGSFPERLTDMAGTLFFTAFTNGEGREWWKSDGTEAGTVLVKDVKPGAGSSARDEEILHETYRVSLTAAVGATFFFVADDGASGEELWKSDGTTAGTVRVKDIFPGARGSEPRHLTRVRNRLFFVADDGVHGRELWVSDGTAAGTFPIDVWPGAASSLPEHLKAMGHLLLFSADNGTHGREAWRSDGTLVGTTLVQNIAPGPLPSSPMRFTAAGTNVYFAANGGTNGFEPWVFPRSVLGSTFGDVPVSFWAWRWIEAMADAGITGGCGGGNYCPDQPVSRAQVSVFLERAMRGIAFVPPPATGTLFNDVPASYWAAAWIEQLANDGVTGGCGGGNFCPEQALDRAAMSVFLLRSRYGPSFTPPPATGTVFGDVPSSYWAAAWIERLAAEGITGGCGGGNFCPGRSVTRAELAVFLTRMFELPVL